MLFFFFLALSTSPFPASLSPSILAKCLIATHLILSVWRWGESGGSDRHIVIVYVNIKLIGREKTVQTPEISYFVCLGGAGEAYQILTGQTERRIRIDQTELKFLVHTKSRIPVFLVLFSKFRKAINYVGELFFLAPTHTHIYILERIKKFVKIY